MAGTINDHSIPTEQWPLWLCDLLAFVTKCLRSEAAAKKFLLDDFARHPVEWRYRSEAAAPQHILGLDRPPLTERYQDSRCIYRFFWRGREAERAQFDVDWEASSVSYEGPLIRSTSFGNLVGPLFDGAWRVKICVSLIRINSAPIVARLRALGVSSDVIAGSLPPALALASKPVPLDPTPPPLEPTPPPPPSSPSKPALKPSPPKPEKKIPATKWLRNRFRPLGPGEAQNDYLLDLHEDMKKDPGVKVCGFHTLASRYSEFLSSPQTVLKR